MEILWLCVFWVIGLSAFSLTTIQCIIILFFAFPYTAILERKGYLILGHNIRKQYIMSLVLLVLVQVLLVWVLFTFGSQRMISGFFLGACTTAFLSIGKTGLSYKNTKYYTKNVKDYVDSNKAWLTSEYLQQDEDAI